MYSKDIKIANRVKISFQHCKEFELWAFINLNLSIVYVRTNRYSELAALLDQLDTDKLDKCSQSMKASVFYVRGLQSFFQAKYNEAK